MVPFDCCTAAPLTRTLAMAAQPRGTGSVASATSRCLQRLPPNAASSCRPGCKEGQHGGPDFCPPPLPCVRPPAYLPTCLQVSADYERVCAGCVNADSSSKTFVRQEGAVADHWSWVHWIWLAALSCCWPSTR